VNPEPTLNDVIDAGILWHVAGHRHTFPATIVAVNMRDQTCTVDSEIEYMAEDSTTGKIIYTGPIRCTGIPIGFYGTGEWGLTGPVAVGDRGLCVVADRCLAEWKSTTITPVKPSIIRRWSSADAIWLPFHCRPSDPLSVTDPVDPGSRPFIDNAANNVVLRVPALGKLILGSGAGSQFLAFADLVLSRLNDIRTAFNGHTHVVSVTGVTAGAASAAGTTVAPTPMAVITSVASNTKSE
jgi:hypothetical protein